QFAFAAAVAGRAGEAQPAAADVGRGAGRVVARRAGRPERHLAPDLAVDVVRVEGGAKAGAGILAHLRCVYAVSGEPAEADQPGLLAGFARRRVAVPGEYGAVGVEHLDDQALAIGGRIEPGAAFGRRDRVQVEIARVDEVVEVARVQRSVVAA